MKLGRYDVIRVLGKGAMGMVYEARDPNLDRKVAIKTIKVQNLTSEEAADYEVRFRTEARSAARLQHPNIVSVYDSDRDGDTAFLVMEYVQGEDLKQHLDKGHVYTLEQTLGIMGDLLSALDYAHRQSIVHRDVKPANLLIEPNGRAKLTDFGVARIQDSGDATRTQGSMVGTLKYMSPEQVQGLAIDARSDLFAAGVVLYQLLTSRRPFDGTSDFDIIQQIVGKPHPDPSNINVQLPLSLDAVMAKALAKDRNDRYTTAQEFSVALHQAARDALDVTVVPPANRRGPGRSATPTSASSAGSRSNGTRLESTSGSNSSTVTQEVELVYWKDIKDSEDIEDFEGFLARFPTGIYADLARRRLKKLFMQTQEGSGAGTQTGTVLMTRAPSGTGPSEDADATVVSYDTTRVEAQRAVAGAAPAKATTETPAIAVQSGALPPEITKSSQGLLWAGAGVLSALALWAYLGMSEQRTPDQLAQNDVPQTIAPLPAASATLPVASAPLPSAAPAALPSVNPASKASTTVRVATGPSSAASASSPVVKERTPVLAPPPKKPAKEPNPSTPTETPASESSPAGAESTSTGDPRKACEGRWFLSYHICMKDQCLKPAFKSHPICVERHAMEQKSQEVRH